MTSKEFSKGCCRRFPRGDRGLRPFSLPPVAPAGAKSPCGTKVQFLRTALCRMNKENSSYGTRRGPGGDRGLRPFSLPPVASAEAKSSCCMQMLLLSPPCRSQSQEISKVCCRRIQGRPESCQRGSRLPPGLRAWSLPQERNPPATQKIKFLGTVVTNLDPTSQNAR